MLLFCEGEIYYIGYNVHSYHFNTVDPFLPIIYPFDHFLTIWHFQKHYQIIFGHFHAYRWIYITQWVVWSHKKSCHNLWTRFSGSFNPEDLLSVIFGPRNKGNFWSSTLSKYLFTYLTICQKAYSLYID